MVQAVFFWLFLAFCLVGLVFGYAAGYLLVGQGVEVECRRVILFYEDALRSCVGVSVLNVTYDIGGLEDDG